MPYVNNTTRSFTPTNVWEAQDFAAFSTALQQQITAYTQSGAQLSDYAPVEDFIENIPRLFGESKTHHGLRNEFAFSEFLGSGIGMSTSMAAPVDLISQNNHWGMQLKTSMPTNTTKRWNITPQQRAEDEKDRIVAAGSPSERLGQDKSLDTVLNFQLATQNILQRQKDGNTEYEFLPITIRSIPMKLMLKHSLNTTSIMKELFNGKEIKSQYQHFFKKELPTKREINKELKNFAAKTGALNTLPLSLLNSIAENLTPTSAALLKLNKTNSTYYKANFDTLINHYAISRTYRKQVGKIQVHFPSAADIEAREYITTGKLPEKWLSNSKVRQAIAATTKKIGVLRNGLKGRPRNAYYNAYYVQNPQLLPKKGYYSSKPILN